MKIIYHPLYTEIYSSDPASESGRIEAILKELEGAYQFLKPQPATEDDIKRVHGSSHIHSIKRDPFLYEIACLAAGGAIMAAEMAMKDEPAFGLIRPPGHHASFDHYWGFCFFNNIAVALAKLRAEKRIEKALIVDFDLHFGDGTDNIFSGTGIEYFQPTVDNRERFVKIIEKKLTEESAYDILAVSAGFDRHVDDWGGELTTEDYRTIGALVKEAAEKVCRGRRFAVLEGGYNHSVLGRNVKSFLEGLD
ncbi:MAG: histone deacetylase family protein [Proteobacteria bacterium]|nr:histone deacetylase family protein [Pseudomonadota bacterium]